MILWLLHLLHKLTRTATAGLVTKCFCPSCHRDLVSQSSAFQNHNNCCPDPCIVTYLCACGTRSAWDFAHYPVPVRIT